MMTVKHITSRENPIYKRLKQLASNAHARRKAKQTLLEGVHLCAAYLQHIGKPLLCAVSETSIAHGEVAPILARCEALCVQCIVLPDALHRALSQVEHGVGLLCEIDIPETSMPQALNASAVLLDNLQDPGNLGSILRSAAAARIQYVFCSHGTAAVWSPKVLRSGMGAHFLLEIFENVDLATIMTSSIVSSAIPVLATSSHAEQSLYDLDLTQPVAWLFGHEGQGVAEELLSLATYRIAIPHLGEVESLNVAASAAVCFFEQVRQIKK